MEREVGGGIGMGNTCKPMAVSFQCMTKSTTIKKKKKKKRQWKATLTWRKNAKFPIKGEGLGCLMPNFSSLENADVEYLRGKARL